MEQACLPVGKAQETKIGQKTASNGRIKLQ